jgi:hypothetical protein
VHCCEQSHRFSLPDLPSRSFSPLDLPLRLQLLDRSLVALLLLSHKTPKDTVPTAECATHVAARPPGQQTFRAVRSCPPTSSQCTMT